MNIFSINKDILKMALYEAGDIYTLNFNQVNLFEKEGYVRNAVEGKQELITFVNSLKSSNVNFLSLCLNLSSLYENNEVKEEHVRNIIYILKDREDFTTEMKKIAEIQKEKGLNDILKFCKKNEINPQKISSKEAALIILNI